MRDSIIMNYFERYQKIKEELPAKARDVDYKRKMELAYPFHPEVIDILYEKWGTFSSFQRTRGVLRLLANVIEDLYNKEKNIDMILPSDIGLEAAAVRLEFLHHIGSEYESIIGSDISGHEAKSISLDKENKGWKHLAERIATTIFFYSFSGDKSEKGATLEYIKFATMHADTIPSMVTEVLQRLDKSLWYLNEKGGMYRFSKIPNLNRMILDKKELYNVMYREEMREIIDKEVGTAFCSVLWPEKSEDIADNKELKLVILRPNENDDAPGGWLEKRGNTFRTYKNTIIFAKANPGGFGAFKDELKTYLALKEIEDEIKANEEGGLKDKATEVAQRLKRIRDDFSFNARRMYNVILVGSEELALGQPTVGKESLSNWYKMALESREKLAPHLHYRYLVNKFMDGRDKIETKVISDQFYKDMSLVIPESPDVIRRAIQQGVAEGAFGLAYVKGEEIDRDTLKFKANIPTNDISLAEEAVLISKEVAAGIVAERERGRVSGVEAGREIYTTGGDTGGAGTGGVVVPGGEVPSGEVPGGVVLGPKRYKKISIRIEGIPSTKIADLSRGVLMPLSREVGGFEFTMEIDIDKAEGVSESTLKDKVKETISQIGARVTKEVVE